MTGQRYARLTLSPHNVATCRRLEVRTNYRTAGEGQRLNNAICTNKYFWARRAYLEAAFRRPAPPIDRAVRNDLPARIVLEASNQDRPPTLAIGWVRTLWSMA